MAATGCDFRQAQEQEIAKMRQAQMDGSVKKMRQMQKIIIPAEGYIDNLENGFVPVVEPKALMKTFVTNGLDGAELIPVDLGGRLVPPTLSINELGKQLIKAATDGNVDEIKALMNKGAPFTADWLGTSPLHFAAQNNHLEVCQILLKAGISKDARTKVDRTPLHIAAYEGHIEIVRCLLECKADIDCKDLLAMTPLHWAAQNCHTEVAELLVRYGAQRNLVNKFSFSPLDIAMQCNRPDIVEIITVTPADLSMVIEQSLSLEMEEIDNSCESVIYPTVEALPTDSNSPIPLETVLLEDIDSENSIDPERLHINQQQTEAGEPPRPNLDVEIEEPRLTDMKFAESLKILQQHGITMLPADDSNILSSILETGHSVVLTDVGKEVLNSIKPDIVPPVPPPPKPKIKTISAPIKPKKIITVTPQEFLAMTLSQGKVISAPKPPVKRIVMRKNKIVPIGTNSNAVKIKNDAVSDVEILMKQLIEARKLVEEYKQKFLKKEAEAERYKQQLRLITQSRNSC